MLTNFDGPDSCSSAYVQDALHRFLDGGEELLAVEEKHQHMVEQVQAVLLVLVVWHKIRAILVGVKSAAVLDRISGDARGERLRVGGAADC